MTALTVLWCIAVFIIFWAMAGYPASLVLIDKLFRRQNYKDYTYEPTVAIMIVAHNEEKVIEEKLKNLLEIDYPADKLEFLIASDFSTDRSDEIAERFIAEHPDLRMRLHRTSKRLGKTNAQNETQPLCSSEILIMTDANAIFAPDAVRELAASFADPSVAYVTGRLRYSNTSTNETAGRESFYWEFDLRCRDIESRMQTITAGNGAIYAVRNEDYVEIPPIESHDSSFPVIYALMKKRAIYNPAALAYEKAAESDADEFNRKVRMSRIVLRGIMPDIRILNIFSYHWFTYFYLGHRSCRYLLWLMHPLALLSNIPAAIMGGWFWKICLCIQVLFYLAATAGHFSKTNNRLFRIITYYSMTVTAQWKAVINKVKGKSEAVWEKTESTR